MTENLIFSINCVMPFFLLILLGILLQKTGIVPKDFFKLANGYVFKVALPFMLFHNIISIKGESPLSTSFMIYTALVTIIAFFVIWGITELFFKDKTIVGTLVQGCYRGNYLLLGIPIAGAVSGDKAVQAAAFASIVAIPLYNILAVVILSARGKSKATGATGVIKEIAANPLIIGMLLSLPFLFWRIRLPEMVMRSIAYVGSSGTPLGLLSVGGVLSIKDATAKLYPAIYASVIKIMVYPAVVMPLSVLAGFRGDELLVTFLLVATPVAVSSYIMASEMGGDASLASNILILTTFFSAFVLALGIYILRSTNLA